jgi:hypothetical protein
MADIKVTGLTELSAPVGGDMLEIVDDPGGTPISKKVTVANLLAVAHTHAQSDVTDLTTDLAAKQATSAKNAASGYAGLDGSSKLTGSQQTYGTGANTACVGNDSRLSDSRTPTAHATSHQNGGGDEVSVAGLSGLLADGQTPLAHATSHKSGGSDAVKLDELAAPTDVTTLDVSATAHGLCPKFPNNTTTFLRGDGTYAAPAGGGGDVVYTGTTADTAVNVTSDATIVTRDITGVAAGDQVLVDAWFVILNNSTATRVYTVTLDFDGLFDIEFATGACATSATLMHPFMLRAICNVRSSSLAYAMGHLQGQLAAGIAAGTDTTVAATHLAAMGWGTSASNATGTLTVALKVRSADATATQTLRLHAFTIRKVTPT